MFDTIQCIEQLFATFVRFLEVLKMNHNISERRIKNNRLKRRRQLRYHIIMCITTILLIAGCSVSLFSFKAKAQSDTEDIAYKYYKSIIVKAGDSLWDYAEEYANNDFYDSYDSYIKEVIRINALSDDSIQSGQYIIVPYYSYEFVG